MISECKSAVSTLYDEFNWDSLLDHGARLDFFLHCEFDFYPLRVRFRPDEAGICKASVANTAFELLNQKSQKLAGFQLGSYPRTWRLEVSIAAAAKVDN